MNEVSDLRARVRSRSRVVRIRPRARAVHYYGLLMRLVWLGLSIELLVVFSRHPSVAYVRGRNAFRFPRREDTMLNVRIRLRVAHLISRISTPIVTLMSTESRLSCAPTSRQINAAQGVPFLRERRLTITMEVHRTSTYVRHRRITIIRICRVNVIRVYLNVLNVNSVSRDALSLEVCLRVRDLKRDTRRVTQELRVRPRNVCPVTVIRSRSRLRGRSVLMIVTRSNVSVVCVVRVVTLRDL